ncbi:MAG: serine/threonine protein kinase [Sandaracinaceae bacterium]|nr:serine/threonine protein kinase [Sandaracinaceae bacterium]MBK7150353.1 serine/threonine protein kinase [Sandaracinaceae bacterium]MBK7777310.1 serine/threonine protein kinase [Sandaracinaceae bacterium]MBK8408809.1 serine/threonine protein kinase [Sandaracinaceae bacterium]MBP7681309.1 serine/threonine protein kinase [Deltaproteobacteria bacterium]
MSRQCPTCAEVFDDESFFCGHDGTITIQVQPENDKDPRLGSQLGDYIVVARVADGGMGRVYEGRHPQTRQRMAIKVLHPEIAADNVAVERFKREYETAAELRHPHVVSVHEFGSTPEGSYFMTMEYLYGEELGAAIRRDGAQPMPRVVQTLCQTALALDHAHSFGVVHRDLKPDNIFLCKRDAGDDVRVLDFGSVKLQMETGPKLTAFGTTLGSPYYMSPEQAMGKSDVDQRTDVFAIAAMLHEMLTGKVAFDGENVAAILMKIIKGEPTPASMLNPDVPAAVDAVIEKGVAKDKAQRYGSVSALADATLAALGLHGNTKEWADKSVAEIEHALANAEPPPPPAYGAPVDDPLGHSVMSMNPRESQVDALPQSSALKWVALGVGAFVLLSVVAAGAWFALG